MLLVDCTTGTSEGCTEGCSGITSCCSSTAGDSSVVWTDCCCFLVRTVLLSCGCTRRLGRKKPYCSFCFCAYIYITYEYSVSNQFSEFVNRSKFCLCPNVGRKFLINISVRAGNTVDKIQLDLYISTPPVKWTLVNYCRFR